MPSTTRTTDTSGTTGRTVITEADAAPAVDPLIELFARIHISYREAIARTLASLTDDELNEVIVLFDSENLANIPYEFWPIRPKVRILAEREQIRRADRLANLEALIGDTEA